MDTVYELLKADGEAGGSGLTTACVWERLCAEDATLDYQDVEEVLFALMGEGFIYMSSLPLNGGMHAATWRILPEQREAMQRRKDGRGVPPNAPAAAPAHEVREEPPAPLACPHCGSSDFIAGRWCTRCMKRVDEARSE